MKTMEMFKTQSFARFLTFTVTLLAITVARADEPAGTKPIDIGSRRELFVDDFLIKSMQGVSLKLHKPSPRDVVLVCDAPWEGNVSNYYTFFRDEDRFRVYYRGLHYGEDKTAAHPQVTCYGESKDGITWTKPKLGLFEYDGSRDNNIIWTAGYAAHNFTPFKDLKPDCASDVRYKALGIGTTIIDGKQKDCLNAYKSSDGVRWALQKEGVITAGTFDSQNLAFWDAERNEYRAYWRTGDEKRAIRTGTSKDFINWENQANLKYVDSPKEHLYTNAVSPYFRAPHLFIAFPTRFDEKTEQVEPIFMTSRDGFLFRRWSDALIPITAPKDRDGNRSNYMTWGVVQLPGDDRELSVYATEAGTVGPATRVRRFVFRIDGFVSAHADAAGTMTTKTFTFTGSQLSLNVVSKGVTLVELQDADGKALPGFTLADCTPITADAIEHIVEWKGGDLAAHAGKPVRLRFIMTDADLYSIRFRE